MCHYFYFFLSFMVHVKKFYKPLAVAAPPCTILSCFYLFLHFFPFPCFSRFCSAFQYELRLYYVFLFALQVCLTNYKVNNLSGERIS
jgi:hypothetical protein